MDFTYLWMLMYGLTLILVVNLTYLISHAFSRENMVQDPVTHRTHYEVPDPGRFSYRTRREELRTGVWLSTYSIILIVAFVILTVFAFIHCNHWWQVPLDFIIASILSGIYSNNFPLRLHSFRYYFTQILTPLAIAGTFFVLCSN